MSPGATFVAQTRSACLIVFADVFRLTALDAGELAVVLVGRLGHAVQALEELFVERTALVS